MLNWVNRFNIFCFLDSHQYRFSHQTVDCMLAAGAVDSITGTAGNALYELDDFLRKHKGEWLFGHLGYDLKNETEGLTSAKADFVGFEDLFFFKPAIVIKLNEKEISIYSSEKAPVSIFNQIIQSSEDMPVSNKPVLIQPRFTEEEYIQTVKRLQQHILRGDCYEINFCQEFFAGQTTIDPLAVYAALNKTSPNPFSAFYRLNEKFLICASPERYLKKSGEYIYSQPIKGTSQRDLQSDYRDELIKKNLFNNFKERSENVMIVDLVRNDLSKFCEEGSVEVEELFGIYSFPQVHQMISTVRGKVKSEISLVDMLRASFPMGSMTGAPKRRVMELIERYERTRRGLFSGAVGYVDPSGDFDFNVVIRSLFYNSSMQYVSFQAGSAITYYSDPRKELEECLIKAAAIKKVLAG